MSSSPLLFRSSMWDLMWKMELPPAGMPSVAQNSSQGVTLCAGLPTATQTSLKQALIRSSLIQLVNLTRSKTDISWRYHISYVLSSQGNWRGEKNHTWIAYFLEAITEGKALSVCQVFSLSSLREVPQNNKCGEMYMPARTVVTYN